MEDQKAGLKANSKKKEAKDHSEVEEEKDEKFKLKKFISFELIFINF